MSWSPIAKVYFILKSILFFKGFKPYQKIKKSLTYSSLKQFLQS